MFNLGQIVRVEQVAGLMAEIEQTTDNDIAEVTSSREKFAAVEQATAPVAGLFSLVAAEQMMGVFEEAPKSPPDFRKLAGKTARQLEKARRDLASFERAAALQLMLEGTFGDPLRIASGTERIASCELKRQFSLLPSEVPDQSSLFPAISVDDRRRAIADDLVSEARALAARHGFLHWEIAFPGVWTNLASAEPKGGFDAVIGNPPYVRQELLGPQVKRALKAGYRAFDGMADLYVYFYEQGLRLLKPGGRMAYVVTNKWLKAGYAEALRGLFAEEGWLEFVADFGHAKHFFPDADVFPSVVTVRKPLRGMPAAEEAAICVIPRDSVPRRGLDAAVAEATFPLPLAMFTKEAWVLEPRPVMDLFDKIRRNGVPLAEYAGRSPINGIKTGLNEAFVVDHAVASRLTADDPKCQRVIRPFRRGQDVERWVSPLPLLQMISLSSRGNADWPWSKLDGEDAETAFRSEFPSLYTHLANFREALENRESRGKFWWEAQTAANPEAFGREAIIYQEIQFYPCYSLNEPGVLSNNKTFIIPSRDRYLLTVLNSPLMWWHNWRFLPHMKDEALSPMSFRMERLPIALRGNDDKSEYEGTVGRLIVLRTGLTTARSTIIDWLRHEFGLEKPGLALAQPHLLDADGFVAAIRKALPRSRKFSAADIARLKQEHEDTLGPARAAAGEALALERRLSDLVNAAYGLTPDEVRLMWETAPPRMPFAP